MSASAFNFSSLPSKSTHVRILMARARGWESGTIRAGICARTSRGVHPFVRAMENDRVGGFPPTRSRPRSIGPPAYLALNCCSTTALAPSTSVAVARRVSLPLTCFSAIWPVKEPALVRVTVT